MTLAELHKIKEYNYEQYVAYLNDKYGVVRGNYCTEGFTVCKDIRRFDEECLYIHHVKENLVSNLSNMKRAKNYPYEYQMAQNLVYCNIWEHAILHILITKEYCGTDPDGIERGMYGAKRILNNIECLHLNEEQMAVFQELSSELNISVDQYTGILQHNIPLFLEVDEKLRDSDRVLIVLGTGLGKTTTGLGYLRRYGYRALVLCPKTSIADEWNIYDEVDAMTYQGFMLKYKTIDYSQYQILICDEAHHNSKLAPRWTEGFEYVLENKLLKVIGLTATPKPSVSEELYNNCVCTGYDLLDGIENSIIHDFSYVGAIYDTTQLREKYKDIADTVLYGELDLALNNTPTLQHIFDTHMPISPRKGIIFVSNIAAMDEAEEIMLRHFPNVQLRRLHSKLAEPTKEEVIEWFKNASEGYLITVDMVGEGVHYPGINTLIMFRRTQSNIVFQQQLGRIITLTKYPDPHGIVFDLVNNANVLETDSRTFAQKLKHAYTNKKRPEKIKSNQVIVQDYTDSICAILRKIQDKQSGYRAVYQIDPETLDIIHEYRQVMIAARAVNGSAGSIYQACYGQVGLASGYYWCFTEDWPTWSPKENHTNHAVWCIELQQKFNKIQQAAEILGISRSSIIKSCQSWNIKAGEYHFCYYEDKEDWQPLKTQYHNQRAVWCVETQTAYDSCAEAGRAVGSGSSDISSVCLGKRKTAGGYHWCYLEDRDNFIIPQQKRNSNYKRVLCVETNIIYDTAAEAERQTGIRRYNIGCACRGIQQTAGGYHWEFVS